MALTRINFVTRPAAATGWRLVLLVVGLLAFGAAGLDWLVQLRAVSRLETQLALAQPRQPQRAPLSVAQQREQDQQLNVIADAVRQLNLPVTRLVKTVQAPRDIRVALLGLDLNGKAEPGEAPSKAASGALKISAEAETAQDMMNYVGFLNEQPLFTSAYLVKHELNAAAPNHAYRFQVEAQWRE
jgi:hypothetical protein